MSAVIGTHGPVDAGGQIMAGADGGVEMKARDVRVPPRLVQGIGQRRNELPQAYAGAFAREVLGQHDAPHAPAQNADVGLMRSCHGYHAPGFQAAV